MSIFHDKQKQLREQMAKMAISEAAIEVVTEKGYDKLTMNDVAEKAGIATGTIYNYFKSKEDLFVFVHEQMHVTISEKLQEVATKDNDPAERIKEFFSEVFAFCEQHKMVIILSKQLGLKDKFPVEQKMANIAEHIQVTQKIIDDGIKQKKFRKVDSLQTASIWFYSLVGLLELYSYLGEESYAEGSKTMIRFFLDYILNKEE
ncbi:MAG: TetR/AcrR family transcriptional regulator [Candidatus Auribacterota bacterium]